MSNNLQVPISSFNEEFRVSFTRQAMHYWDSKDTRVASAGIVVQTGRKCRAQQGLGIVES